MDTKVILTVTELQASLFQPFRMTSSYLNSFLQNTLKSNQVEVNTDNKTLKPIAKLKQPRDLFALPKELDCAQQAARWPSECQVLEERVQHIDYIPPSPELYYQPTGKEIQPKPVGEEDGTIVFQYYPMSAVNYFSKSSVGGSRYFLPACPINRENEDDLKFESRFESGNLAKVFIGESIKGRQFVWRRNAAPPVFYKRCTVECDWMEAISEEEDEMPNYTLSFNIEFPHDQDEVYLAHCYPYTYTDLQDYLNKLQNHPIKSNFTKLRLLCRSLAGNNVYYVTITEPPIGDETKKKKAVVVTARVHPGETPSSWVMKGFIDFLTGDSSQAKELREKFIFKLVPMLNPDGVIVGNNRCSLTGRDLNRQYRTVIRETYPSVWHTKLMVRRLMEECGIVMYCDLHAHSRKHNVFIYGCENKRSVDKRLQEQVFPLMLHKNAADKFSFENCKFRIQKSKEGTGRVVVWMMGVANSYTMETSFGGSTIGSRVNTHFNIQDFENMGRAFCETLLDFCDEEPNKVEISNTLFKSSNVNLYFKVKHFYSDEGDSSSSSGDCPLHKNKNSTWTGDTFNTSDAQFGRPPSSTHPKKNHGPKPKARVSSAKITKKVSIVEKTPPMIRKPFQVHKTTLGPPCMEQVSDRLEVTTEMDSADESTSWQKGIRKYKLNERGKKLKKRYMPPELIVTPAQVCETDTCNKVVIKEHTKHTGGSKRTSTDKTKEKFRLWHQGKYLQAQSKAYKSICDLTAEIQLKMGTSLKQRVWTGCPCLVNQTDSSLSKGDTYWSKGPLIFSSNSSTQGNKETASKSTTKTTAQLITHKNILQVEIQRKKKTWPKKSSKLNRSFSQRQHENVIDTSQEKLMIKKTTKFQRDKRLSPSLDNDPTSQVALLKLKELNSSNTRIRRGSNEIENKIVTKSSKFRKSGTDISNYRYDSGESDSEKTNATKQVYKKKNEKATRQRKRNKYRCQSMNPD
ncbi:hypothetical protein RUM44_013083 [Polyplax serrata]|uniref:Peptidase M14 domain-containing protein n=1 Tax=Polyplax serrata TaxID=468196 RepID=A0ABR1BF33_POLSC